LCPLREVLHLAGKHPPRASPGLADALAPYRRNVVRAGRRLPSWARRGRVML